MVIARRIFIAAAVAGLLAHVVNLAIFGDRAPGPLISNIIQFALGVGATFACFVARANSGKFSRKVWLLTGIGIALYTTGQGFVIYYDSIIRAPLHSPWLSDQFLFFWVVPLLMSALIDPWPRAGKIDWQQVLDYSQVVIFAVALHVAMFGIPFLWERRGEELAFLEWQVRLLRDGVILSGLLARVVLASLPKTRQLYTRLLIFFSAYALADGIYLYAQAAWQSRSGTFLDLLWTIPRVLLIAGALTWNDTKGEIDRNLPVRSRIQILPLHLAPILGPLLVLLVASQFGSALPGAATALVAIAFGCASARFLITQHRQDQTSAELKHNRDLLEAVIEGTNEAVYLRDLNGRYVLANQAAGRVLNKTKGEIIGRTDQELFSPGAAAIIRKSDEEVIKLGKPFRTEETLVVNGVPHNYLSMKGPHRDQHGKIIGVLGIAVDVTDRRRMEEQLRKTQRMESVGTLAGGVAHDFNNLLTVIKGYSQLIADTTQEPIVKEQIADIESAADKAAALTRQLLAFSRRQVMQPKVLSLNSIFQDMEKMLRRMIGEDVEFRAELDSRLHTVIADPAQIEQVIMNLVANARDAMPRGGMLTLRTSNVVLDEEYSRTHLDAPPGEYVLLEVSDTGVGMDRMTQARIFEPFFTTKEPGKGTGLGLSTVYGIVKQSGGYIWVYSEVGLGTTFKLYFPASTRVVESAPAPTIFANRTGAETVLVAEDDETLRQLVESVLAKTGYRVLVADSAARAEQIAREHNGDIHLLITDVVMPQVSGRQLAENLLTIRPKTKVLWMSGYAEEMIAHHGMLDDGIQFLQKPFSPAELKAKVREVLDAAPDPSTAVR
jgi:PAS domain S-box-containing protein